MRRERIRLFRAATDVCLPFRWDISHRETFGGLLKTDRSGASLYSVPPKSRAASIACWTPYEGFFDNLLSCVARIVAAGGDADLVFVGRSLDNCFDLLSALLCESSWLREPGKRLTLLRFSHVRTTEDYKRRKQTGALSAYRAYLDSLALSPAKLIVRERPVALTDVICHGDTIQELLGLIREWTLEEKRDWPSVRRKLRVVGLLRAGDSYSEPPRPIWKQRRDGRHFERHVPVSAAWDTKLLDRGAFRGIAVPDRFWEFIADLQPKTSLSYSPTDWGTEEAAHPSHRDYCLAGLRAARTIYEAGCSPITRARFAKLLAAEASGMRNAECRRLVQEVRKR